MRKSQINGIPNLRGKTNVKRVTLKSRGETKNIINTSIQNELYTKMAN